MPHASRIIPTQLNADTILDAISEVSSGNVTPQSDSWSEKEKSSVANFDLSHVTEGHREHFRQILKRFDNTVDGQFG